MKKVIIFFVAGLFVVFIVAGVIAGNYLCDYAILSPSADSASADPAFAGDYSSSGYVNVSDVFRTSSDGVQLHALKVLQEQPSNRWAIVIHGYGGSGSKMMDFARQYYYSGYNLLLPDLRGSGLSDGKYYGMGWPDRLDMVEWANELVKADQDIQIVFHGVSMGGATVMMLSGESLPSNVKCLVEDCGYTSVYDEFSARAKAEFHLPAFPLIDFASLASKFKAGYSFREASSVKQLKKNVTPILFIHGSADTYVPYEMVNKNYAATDAPKQLLTVDGAAHAQSDEVDNQLYWSTVFDFTGKYIK